MKPQDRRDSDDLRQPMRQRSAEVEAFEKKGGVYTCRMGMIDIASLSIEERLRLPEQLRESLSATPQAIPLTNAHREELDRRLDEMDRGGPAGIPWEGVLGRVRRRRPVMPIAARPPRVRQS